MSQYNKRGFNLNFLKKIDAKNNVNIFQINFNFNISIYCEK